ncbi:hypothetical protein CVT26_002904, partial [Gymnopilus dilepis]
RPVHIVNLDPANHDLPYPCAIDIGELVKLEDVMRERGLGPNGAMLWAMEYLEVNWDWLEGRLRGLEREAQKEGGEQGDLYVLFDLPGQVELSTNHESVRNIVGRLQKQMGFRLAAVHLCDAHYITDASKYISVLLLSLRAMLHLELPHINVLSKIDLLHQYGELGTQWLLCVNCSRLKDFCFANTDFNLDFYTEVQDLSYLENTLNASLPPRFAALNLAITSLIEDFGLVAFETLAVEDKTSMLNLTRAIDRATGYIFVPPPSAPQPPGTILPPAASAASERPNTLSLFSSAMGRVGGAMSDVRDVQERWVDQREAYDAFERREWRREGEAVRDAVAREKAEKEEAGAAHTGASGGGKKPGIRKRVGPAEVAKNHESGRQT